MPREDQLKDHVFPRWEGTFERSVVNGTEYVRDPDGVWRYADTWIKVPGARDLTLTERFRPKVVLGPNQEVERVIVSQEDIMANPDLLDWCHAVGTPINGPKGMIREVIVPIDAWEEHDRIPGEIVAPEHGDDPAARELAEAEREYREADRALDSAAAKRAEVLRRHSDNMTRQHARAITDLSVGRIQQLIREGVTASLDGIDFLLLSVLAVEGPLKPKGLQKKITDYGGMTYPTELIQARINSLVEQELFRTARDGLAVTPEGEEALNLLSAQSHEADNDEGD